LRLPVLLVNQRRGQPITGVIGEAEAQPRGTCMRFNDSTRAAVREALTGADTVAKAEAEVTGRWVKAAEALAADGIASLAAFSEAKEAIRAELVIPALRITEVSDAPSVWRKGAELPKAGSEAEAMEVAKVRARAKAEGKDEVEAVAAFKAEWVALRKAYQTVRTTANVMVSRLKEYLPEVRAKAEAEAKADAEAEAKAEAEAAGMTVAQRAEAGKADAVHKATEAVAKVLTRLQKAGTGAAAYPHLEAALAALIVRPSIVEGTATGPSHAADALTPMGRPAGLAA
jgi:colicin import membrane protein